MKGGVFDLSTFVDEMWRSDQGTGQKKRMNLINDVLHKKQQYTMEHFYAVKRIEKHCARLVERLKEKCENSPVVRERIRQQNSLHEAEREKADFDGNKKGDEGEVHIDGERELVALKIGTEKRKRSIQSQQFPSTETEHIDTN